MNKYILQMQKICKSFNNVPVLKDVNFNVRVGTVMALMGENGAGKSTLMKCLFGIHKIDSGNILYCHNPITINNTKDALNQGIVMVNQELQLLQERSIAENIFCGRYPLKKNTPLKIIDFEKMYTEADKYLSYVGLNISSKTLVNELNISEMQLVEIAKAISYNAKLIILDEPTSSLTSKETKYLFNVINNLKYENVSFIYISHKIDEILKISDEVTILRDGSIVGTYEAQDLTTDDIIKNMVGHKFTTRFPEKENKIGRNILTIENFSDKKEKSFENINFTLRDGEILGIGGLIGSKRSELMEGLFGITELKSGKIIYNNETINISSPKDAINNHISYVTEDRHKTGIFPDMSVSSNICISSIDNCLNKSFIINNKKVNDKVHNIVNDLNIKITNENMHIKYLSGGNQQKALLGRALLNNPEILILDEPTRGIDVKSKYEIYCIMAELTKKGTSIIMISSEMPELIGMSDRILVMSNGKIAGELDKNDVTEEKIMELSTKYL